MAKQKAPRIGRPPRTDRPERVLIVLPGETRRWLRAQSAREGRAQGDIVAAALGLYRKRVSQRRGQR